MRLQTMCLLAVAMLLNCISSVQAQNQQQPFEVLVGNVSVGDSPNGDGFLKVPFLTWGGDVATFLANGGLKTTPDSIFGKLGLKIELVNGDDPVLQVRRYMTGESPFYRGTMRMACLPSEMFNSDARTKPVMAFQMTFSVGDHMVGTEAVKTLNDLKGKRVALQQGGPHLDLVDDALAAAALSWSDIKIVWKKNLTGKDSPAEALRSGEADAACVITPDMIGLCSGLDQKGSGAEGTLKNSHVVVSTASMSRSIVDGYWVRSDFYAKNKEWVRKFTVGYLKGCELLLAEKKSYNDGTGSSPTYLKALGLAQAIYGKEVLPTIEEDAHGLVSDARFVRIPGNESFFNDANNQVGFEAKQLSGLVMAQKLGYIKKQFGFVKPDWDYKALSKEVGVEYVPPVYATGRIRAEVADFGDFDDVTIFTFDVKFKPEQKTFSIVEYASEFERFCKANATFGNSAIIVEGHSDPTLALMNFFYAAKAKGLLTGDKNNYQFNGQPLQLADVNSVVKLIQRENLAGQKRSKDGTVIEIEDPKVTVAAAIQLSKARADAVKEAIAEYAKKQGYAVSMDSVIPVGTGISNPVIARPQNVEQAKENMRVTFRVVKVKAESVSDEDFSFEDK